MATRESIEPKELVEARGCDPVTGETITTLIAQPIVGAFKKDTLKVVRTKRTIREITYLDPPQYYPVTD